MGLNAPSEPWGSCPECAAGITPSQTACTGCGFPLKPGAAAPAAARTPSAGGRKKMRRRGRGPRKPLPGSSEEPPGAMVFAVLGLFVPILAFVGLGMSKRGSGAYILSWIDIGLWISSILVIVSRYH